MGDLVSGRHQGQQQSLHKQAGHKTVPDQRNHLKILANPAPSTQDKLAFACLHRHSVCATGLLVETVP